ASDLASRSQILKLLPDEPLLEVLKLKEQTSLATYTRIDDYAIQSALQRWSKSEDPVLSDLAARIVERRLFKTLDVSKVKGLLAREKKAREFICKAGLDPRYYFIIDTSGDIPYKAYD